MRTRGGIIIPSGVTSVRPPKFHCTLCRASFHEGEASAYARHVAKCVKSEHGDRVRAYSIREALPGLYGPEAGDPEHERWVRLHGRVR